MSVEVERSVGNPPIFWYEDKKISADEAYDLHVSGTPFEERIYPLEILSIPGQPTVYWHKDKMVCEEDATQLYASGVHLQKRTV